MIQIIKYKQIYFTFSAALVVISLIALGFFKLDLGIDFTGGSEMTLKLAVPVEKSAVVSALTEFNLKNQEVVVSDQKLVLKTAPLTEEKHQKILTSLQTKFVDQEIVEEKYDLIGSVLGQELQKKAGVSILMVLVAIILYLAWAFRGVSQPASWKYGLTAVITLAHDVLIVLGLFAFLNQFFDLPLDSSFVAALLTILGYSVNDTIVVFDRTRENLRQHKGKSFSEIINTSLNQTIVRSLNTSSTTLFVLLSILLFGGDSLRSFIIALIAGVVIGTYSSIFLASPLLTVWLPVRKK